MKGLLFRWGGAAILLLAFVAFVVPCLRMGLMLGTAFVRTGASFMETAWIPEELHRNADDLVSVMPLAAAVLAAMHGGLPILFTRFSTSGLGGWPVVTFDEARMVALENRRAARRGEDPFRKAPAVKTFGQASAACREANAGRCALPWTANVTNTGVPCSSGARRRIWWRFNRQPGSEGEQEQ